MEGMWPVEMCIQEVFSARRNTVCISVFRFGILKGLYTGLHIKNTNRWYLIMYNIAIMSMHGNTANNQKYFIIRIV